MSRFRTVIAAVVALGLLAGVVVPVHAQDTDATTASPGSIAAADTFLVKPKNFGRAAGQVVLVNLVVWSFNRFIREGGTSPVFRVGFNSWAENLEAGWNWDDNSFSTNQIAHPYHGNLYFNAARSNGYNYWESIPFAFAGSFMWEYFGETHHPSLNDWISTSMGGAFLGEVLHRFATTVRDNEATGGERNWREVGGMLIDPVGGLTRIMDGDWARQGRNPAGRFPKNYRSALDIGLRTRGEERLWEADTTDVYLGFDFDYGDPFFGDLDKPFDTFDFAIEMYFGDKTSVGSVNGSGLLGGMFLKETDPASHIIAGFHRYDYLNTNALEFGGQSITAGLLSRFETAHGFELRTDMQLGPIILGGASSDYANVSGRSYDYGPGAEARFTASFGRDGWKLVEVSHQQFWIHSISGNDVDHHYSRTKFSLSVPLKYNIGMGAEYILDLGERNYADYDDVSTRDPQARVFLRWILN